VLGGLIGAMTLLGFNYMVVRFAFGHPRVEAPGRAEAPRRLAVELRAIRARLDHA
jgi:hypothetical protein